MLIVLSHAPNTAVVAIDTMNTLRTGHGSAAISWLLVAVCLAAMSDVCFGLYEALHLARY
jgi:hypothetical protein